VDARLRQRILSEAGRFELTVEASFHDRLDSYINRFFRSTPANRQTIIQAYLAQAGLRIARSEGKRTAQAEDVKAAIWLYHLPSGPDDPCAAAGNQILIVEDRRSLLSRGLLTESFREFLDEIR
jgi:hypothetical protein